MKKKKILNLDGKKRITLGKLIPRETTFFEVEKKSDGSLILIPKSDLDSEELWVYKNKSAYKSLKKGLLDMKKRLVTRIREDFWMGV